VSRSWTASLAIVCLLAALCWQAFAFHAFCAREILPIFPRRFDQASYLGRVLDLYFGARERGAWTTVRDSLAWPLPQGPLLPYEAWLAYMAIGASRMSALWINFAHLALCQIALVLLSRWAARPFLGLALCGVLVSVPYLFADTGGMPDFRFDFAAFCLFGVLLCAVIRSGGFRSRGWSAIAGVVAGVLGVTRTIAFIYLAAALPLIVAGLWLLRRWRGDRTPRLGNLLVSTGVAAACVAPMLVAQWPNIVAYYIVGHVTSGESQMRAAEFGVHSTLAGVTFYARSALLYHAGPVAAAQALTLLASLFLLTRRGAPDAGAPEVGPNGIGDTRPDPEEASRLSDADLAAAGVFIAALCVTTYAVLTMDVSKSPVVGSVFVCFGVMAAWLIAYARIGPGRTRMTRAATRWSAAVCAIIFLAGQGVFAMRAARPASYLAPASEIDAYLELMDEIGRASAQASLRAPVVSFDALTEYFHVDVLRVLAAERLRLDLRPRGALGAVSIGLRPITPRDAFALLRQSDFLVIGRDRPVGPAERYPINQSLAAVAPLLYEAAAREFVPLRQATFFGRTVTLFMQPRLSCPDRGDGWVGADGIRCGLPAAALQRQPAIELRGTAPVTWLGGLPGARIIVRRDGELLASTPCDTTATGPVSDGRQPYLIACRADAAALRPTDTAAVQIDFDRHFVPRDVGAGADARQLVMPWPAISKAGTP
jgi:hypothetical protein